MAVAEAAQNAMDSIKESGRTGKIEVELNREPQLVSENPGTGAVCSVTIRDDGVGFTPDNFDSFCTPDSVRKLKSGGKGLGRLMCLQAFERIDVVSVFRREEANALREFVLQSEQPELQQRVMPTTRALGFTEVKLIGLRPEYRDIASLEFGALVEWLCEHFLATLVEKPAWLAAFIVRDGDSSVDLTAKVSGSAVWKESFKVNNYEFHGACYSLGHDDLTDQVRLVAGGRIVDANTRSLDHYLPHLSCVAEDEGHVVLVRSAFFDEHVNDARNGVPFNEDGEERAVLGVTAAQFRDSLADALKRRLSDRLQQAQQELRARIERVVNKEARYYRPLLQSYFGSKEFFALSRSARDEEILASLDLFKRREVILMKRESKRLAKLKAEDEGWEKSARELASKIEMQKQVALAEYVSLRKLVLDRLEQLLSAKSDGHAELEKAIHNLVFPQHVDTESGIEVPHQLWILDERLESHAYLASERSLQPKGDRPDVLIAFNHPGVFANDPKPKAKGYERIAMVEFKRALGDLADLPTDELPHRQMIRYARQILAGKAEHFRTRRPIQVTSDVRFYFYSVCEVSERLLNRLMTEENFMPSPTGDGAFSVQNGGTYYFEYISLPKLLEDAQARNSAFFRRLGLEG